jgi:hypothetical protein
MGMGINDFIKSIICPEAFIQKDNIPDSLLIEEPDNTANKMLRSVRVTGLNEVYAALKLDTEGFEFTGNLILKGNYKKSCDALLFCRVGSQNYVLIIELKSNEYDMKEVLSKFRNARATLDWMMNMFKAYHGSDLPFDGTRVIPVLFDRKLTKGASKQDSKGYKFIHYGFGKPDNEGNIKSIINKW